MYEAQNGLCAICYKPQWNNQALVVDHDHQTLEVRGLLCTPCNTILGRWDDSPAAAHRAAEYLVKHRQLKLVV